jgi:hypothetical protein
MEEENQRRHASVEVGDVDATVTMCRVEDVMQLERVSRVCWGVGWKRTVETDFVALLSFVHSKSHRVQNMPPRYPPYECVHTYRFGRSRRIDSDLGNAGDMNICMGGSTDAPL